MPNPSNKYEPTDQDRGAVEGLVYAGIGQDSIATFLGISKTTLHENFKDELANGKTSRVLQLSNTLTKKALGWNPDFVEGSTEAGERHEYDPRKADITGLIFSLKARGGVEWVDDKTKVVKHEHSGTIEHRQGGAKELARRLAVLQRLSEMETIDGGELKVIENGTDRQDREAEAAEEEGTPVRQAQEAQVEDPAAQEAPDA